MGIPAAAQRLREASPPPSTRPVLGPLLAGRAVVSKPFPKSRLGRGERQPLRLRVELPLQTSLVPGRRSGRVTQSARCRSSRRRTRTTLDGCVTRLAVAFIEAVPTTRRARASAPRFFERSRHDRSLPDPRVAVANAFAEADGHRRRPGASTTSTCTRTGKNSQLRLHPLGQGQSTFQERQLAALPQPRGQRAHSSRLVADPAKRQVLTSTRWCARPSSHYVNPRWLTPQPRDRPHQQMRAAALADARESRPSNGRSEAAVVPARGGGVIAAREQRRQRSRK